MRDLDRPARILLVDDNANDVELTLDAFHEEKLGNDIDVAMSGQEALDRLFGRTRAPGGGRLPLPDLVLLDIKMPGIDGFEVLRQIKAAPFLRRIPVVILTSSREEGDRAMTYDTGANSYLVKPISFEGMLDVVRGIQVYWLTINVRPPMPDPEDRSDSTDLQRDHYGPGAGPSRPVIGQEPGPQVKPAVPDPDHTVRPS